MHKLLLVIASLTIVSTAAFAAPRQMCPTTLPLEEVAVNPNEEQAAAPDCRRQADETPVEGKSLQKNKKR